jgi:hypothetical protein
VGPDEGQHRVFDLCGGAANPVLYEADGWLKVLLIHKLLGTLKNPLSGVMRNRRLGKYTPLQGCRCELSSTDLSVAINN